jgi:hypothetical protein
MSINNFHRNICVVNASSFVIKCSSLIKQVLYQEFIMPNLSLLTRVYINMGLLRHLPISLTNLTFDLRYSSVENLTRFRGITFKVFFHAENRRDLRRKMLVSSNLLKLFRHRHYLHACLRFWVIK